MVLTSNRTRELHDALKRRCLYHWIDHPGLEREVEIVRAPAARGPRAAGPPGGRASSSSCATRDDLLKPPGVAETLDWARALTCSAPASSTWSRAAATLGALVKYREDAERVRPPSTGCSPADHHLPMTIVCRSLR